MSSPYPSPPLLGYQPQTYTSMPKRVSGHMLFLSTQEQRRPTLKIGHNLQNANQRAFYSQVSDVRPHKYSILNHTSQAEKTSTETSEEYQPHPFFPPRSTESPIFDDSVQFQDTPMVQDLIEECKKNSYIGEATREAVLMERQRGQMTGSLYPVKDYCAPTVYSQGYATPYDRNGLNVKEETRKSVSVWKSTAHSSIERIVKSDCDLGGCRRGEEGLFGVVEKKKKSKTALTDKSCFQIDFEKDPALLIGRDDRVLPKRVNDVLLKGTTKVTSHLPGYSGFLPSNADEKVQRLVNGDNAGRNVNKICSFDTYSHNIPNYAGYRFLAAKNDHGMRKPSNLSTAQDALMEPYILRSQRH